MKRLFVIAPLLVLVGCAQNISPNSYSVGSVGMVNRTIAGTVISAGVDISGTSALGGTAGAAVGATAGSALGGEFVLISLVPLVVQSLVVLRGGNRIFSNKTNRHGICCRN